MIDFVVIKFEHIELSGGNGRRLLFGFVPRTGLPFTRYRETTGTHQSSSVGHQIQGGHNKD